MNKKITEKSINSVLKIKRALEQSINGVDKEIIIRHDK